MRNLHKTGENRVAIAAGVAIVLAGTVLRITAARDCFWLDEIWSYFIALRADHILEIFTKFNIVDNNHHLNTLFMYLTGETRNWVWYRVPSIITGSLLLVLIWRAAAAQSTVAGLLALVLAAASYPLILYSSEARGYAPALFFIMASFFLMQQYWDRKNIPTLLLFWLTTTLGLLANLSVAFTWFAIIIWSSLLGWNQTRSLRITITELIKCHSVPFFLWLFLVRSYITINTPLNNLGTRSPELIVEFLATTGTALTGAPQQAYLFLTITALALILFIFGYRDLYRKSATTAIFFLTAACLPPLLCILGRESLHFRFSLAAFPFVYIIMAHGLAVCLKNKGIPRIICCLFCICFLFGNTIRIYSLIHVGRGEYLKGIRYMAEQSQGRQIVVASDNDFRNKMVLDFYARFLPKDKQLVYIHLEKWLVYGSDWLILHDQQVNAVPKPFYRYGTHMYRLKQTFPYGGVSGWNWFLYRNMAMDTSKHTHPATSVTENQAAPPSVDRGGHIDRHTAAE